MPTTSALYQQYTEALQKIADIKFANAVLQWDQETYLPAKGAGFRGRQMATLSEVAHGLFIDDKIGDLLKALNARTDLSAWQQKNVQLTTEEYEKAVKYPPSFVREMSEAISAAYHAWLQARKQNSFALFEKPLNTIVQLKRKEADLLGYEGHVYNALLNEYEKGATVTMLDNLFNEVRLPLKNLLDSILKKMAPEDSFLRQYFSRDQQWLWANQLAGIMGFDFEAGRQDISEHPFTTNFNSLDVRITTRIDDHDFANMTWSTMHEVGHALYEQGLPESEYGLPLGEYASLGIHESQSRLWENCVGRGKPFWQYHLPALQQLFPSQLGNIGVDDFVRGINKVTPSLIRTEADELTYHFHVMIRYELEKLLIAGELLVADIPAWWNEQYKQMLGVKVPDDKRGCLQDVHWSHGSFGYFATYSLGSFYAAQFWKKVTGDFPNLQANLAATGNTDPLLQWLRPNIHRYGKLYTSEELCKKVTGSGLDSKVFFEYLKAKL